MKKKKKKPNFPIGVLELCFLFAVIKEKKRNYTTFHRFFKNISRLYTLELQKKNHEEEKKIWEA